MQLGTLLVIVICFTLSACDDQSTLCATWGKIENILKQQDEHVLCSREDNCSRIDCSGNAYGYSIQSGFSVNYCTEPPSLDFTIIIPKLGINIVNKTILNGDDISIKDNLKVEFQLKQNATAITMGLFAEFIHIQPLADVIPSRIPIIQQITFPVGPCVSAKTDASIMVEKHAVTASPTSKSYLVVSTGPPEKSGNCSITNNSCMPNEMCLQIDKFRPYGFCVCISDFERDSDGVCVYHPTQAPSSESPGGHSAPRYDDSNVSLLLTAILVPITVILMIIGIVYTTIRFRICQHLRRRLRVQVYEHVLLGQDDEEDTEPEMTNPVV